MSRPLKHLRIAPASCALEGPLAGPCTCGGYRFVLLNWDDGPIEVEMRGRDPLYYSVRDLPPHEPSVLCDAEGGPTKAIVTRTGARSFELEVSPDPPAGLPPVRPVPRS